MNISISDLALWPTVTMVTDIGVTTSAMDDGDGDDYYYDRI